ncbi:MAG TPA: Rrf2 family transcriptional regulator [Spirochaetia bacterium]|nr:Rrf2 family transcriptional regulator [Spirochaetia bacterium]
MQITRKTDYAIRCVYYLAANPTAVTMIGEIASRMDIPNSFLAKIAQKLAQAGIVRSHRGANGGFTLAKAPSDISLFDIMVLMEGPVALNMCAVRTKECELSGTCSIHPFWVQLRRGIEEKLKAQRFDSLQLAPALVAARGFGD